MQFYRIRLQPSTISWRCITTQNVLLPTWGAQLMQAEVHSVHYQCWAIRCVFKSKWQTRISKLNDILQSFDIVVGCYACRIQLYPHGNFTISESSWVSAACCLTAGETAYHGIFFHWDIIFSITGYLQVRFVKTDEHGKSWICSLLVLSVQSNVCFYCFLFRRFQLLFSCFSNGAIMYPYMNWHAEWEHQLLAWPPGIVESCDDLFQALSKHSAGLITNKIHMY